MPREVAFADFFGHLSPAHHVLYEHCASVDRPRLLDRLAAVLPSSPALPGLVLRDPFAGLTVLDLAFLLEADENADDLVCDVLDLLLPKVVAEVRAHVRMAYDMRFGPSLAKTLGWLVLEGRGAALESMQVPALLDALTLEHAPRAHGFRACVEQPRVADNCEPFRAIGSDLPFLTTEEEIGALLPPAEEGASAVASLEVLVVAGLFHRATGFFRGLCETPQADESVLFAHPAVKAGVLVKWEKYAKVRFQGLFVTYAVFLALFTAWTVAETAAELDESPGPRGLRILVSAFASFYVSSNSTVERIVSKFCLNALCLRTVENAL